MFNLKQSAKTMLFLKENGIGSHEELVEKSDAACVEYDRRLEKIKAADKRLAEIKELQKQIGTYGKTLETYRAYKASKRDPDFYEANRTAIALHEAARNHFDELGFSKNKKIPPMNLLKQEYGKLSAEKKKQYSGWGETKERRMTLLTARCNVENILGVNKRGTQKRHISHER